MVTENAVLKISIGLSTVRQPYRMSLLTLMCVVDNIYSPTNDSIKPAARRHKRWSWVKRFLSKSRRSESAGTFSTGVYSTHCLFVYSPEPCKVVSLEEGFSSPVWLGWENAATRSEVVEDITLPFPVLAICAMSIYCYISFRIYRKK